MLNKLKEKLNQKIGQRKNLKQLQFDTNKKLEESKTNYLLAEKAQIIIQEVSKIIQNQIKIHIEDIVSYALNSIFIDNYQFTLNFITRRNITECDIKVIKNKKIKLNLKDDTGGGIRNICSFTLRIALWNLLKDNKNNTFIFDQAFKDINDPQEELQLKEKIGIMIKKLSEKFNLQILLLGENDDFYEIADKIFEVKYKNDISQVKEIVNY
jgi:hypothetical protein